MPTIPQARFDDFLKDIEPSRTTKSNASSAHNELRDFLKNDEDFKDYYQNSFLSGSYRPQYCNSPAYKERTD